jgi:predicted transcriptional regulator
MTSLPASIETYLQEAGFSSTEILVLKRLMEGEAMTLRELAAKTGKSTGVLDQATKKLSEKGIVVKENINGTPKYTLSSLDAIKQWMEKDMNQKKDVMQRKKQDFDAFLSTVEHEKNRPEMEYFEGLEGLQKAFIKLLDKNQPEWLHFVPAMMREEDDPLREFRVQLFRERRKNKVFMRTIGQDVPLGRRYQSRDVFEYRDSRLVSVDQFPVSFEEFIVGDTVACFDIMNQKASFIHYPAMADSQRHMFEKLWCQAGEEACTDDCDTATPDKKPQEPDMQTRVMSGLREFFMSKKGLAALALSACIAVLITFGMYWYTLGIMKEEIGQRLVSIVATAAPEIDYRDLEKIHWARDMHKPEYQRLFNKLNEIRDSNNNILYAYIMRPSDDPEMYEFVVDADSNYFLPEDPEDPEAIEVVAPGVNYDSHYFGKKYADKVMVAPVMEEDFVTDKWGTLLPAAAPIFDDLGNSVAFIGIDMDVTDLYEAVNNKFKGYIWFFSLFSCAILLRLIPALVRR